MKKAILSVLAFEVQCPHCKDAITHNYTDSYMWLLRDGDVPVGIVAGQTIECPSCGGTSELPKVISDKLPVLRAVR